MHHSSLLSKDEYLRKILALIVEHYAPEQVYLFGSKARGEEGPGSDYDLLIVVKRRISRAKVENFTEKRWDARLFGPTDIVIWTKKSFEAQAQLRASLPASVLEEGELLYDAA